jgi:Ca2+-binding RTX toxin-like protein
LAISARPHVSPRQLDRGAPSAAVTEALAEGNFIRVTFTDLRVAWFVPAEQVLKVTVGGRAGNDNVGTTGLTGARAWVLGERGDDNIVATGGATISGGAGNDQLTLYGSTQHHGFILGDSGDDMIIGSAGDDYIEGGDGNDVILTSHGRDIVEAGAGNDTIGCWRGALPGLSGVADVADYLDGGEGIDRLWSREFTADTSAASFEKYTRTSDTTLWENLSTFWKF